MCSYYQKKSNLLWIVYALRKDKKVADFASGQRTKLTLQKVTDTLVLRKADNIYTDKLNLHGSIIPANVHCTAYAALMTLKKKPEPSDTHKASQQENNLFQQKYCYA